MVRLILKFARKPSSERCGWVVSHHDGPRGYDHTCLSRKQSRTAIAVRRLHRLSALIRSAFNLSTSMKMLRSRTRRCCRSTCRAMKEAQTFHRLRCDRLQLQASACSKPSPLMQLYARQSLRHTRVTAANNSREKLTAVTKRATKFTHDKHQHRSLPAKQKRCCKTTR